jgi:cytochrome c-type protein NapC
VPKELEGNKMVNATPIDDLQDAIAKAHASSIDVLE